MFNRHRFTTRKSLAKKSAVSNFIITMNKRLEIFIGNVFRICCNGSVKPQYIKTVIREFSVFATRRFTRKILLLEIYDNSLMCIFPTDVSRKHFYVWSHYQRHAGLPFDHQSWQNARESALARRRASGKEARQKLCASRP